NYASKSHKLKYQESGDLDLGAITLEEGSRIEGIVVDARRTPLAGVNIILTDQADNDSYLPFAADVNDNTSAPLATSGKDGRFVIEGVDAGQCFLSGNKDGLVCEAVATIAKIGEVTHVT